MLRAQKIHLYVGLDESRDEYTDAGPQGMACDVDIFSFLDLQEGRAELEREEEERKKLPREANNGKLYGVMLGNASRKAYVRGKDFKQQCAKCGTVLDNEPCVGFIEGEKSKTVKRRYGDDPRDSKSWKGSFSFTDRMFR